MLSVGLLASLILGVAASPFARPPAAPVRHHALLIGVPAYLAPGVTPLPGAKHDVAAMREALLHQGFLPDEIHTLITPEQTRLAAIKAAIRTYLGSTTQAGDAVLLYWTGHGTTALDRPPQSHPDGQEQVLLTYDSRMVRNSVVDPDSALLGSVLGKLLSEVYRHTENVTVVIDSCFSGSATRGVMSSDMQTKAVANPETGPRTHPEQVLGPDLHQIVALSACQNDEHAIEATEGQVSPFTRAFVAALAECQRLKEPRYHDLYVALCNAMPAGTHQRPVIEGSESRIVFGGLAPWRPYFGIVRSSKGLQVLAGEVHGVRPGTRIALYRMGMNVARDRPTAVGTVTSTALDSCIVALPPADANLAPSLAGGAAIIQALSMPDGGMRLDVSPILGQPETAALIATLQDRDAIRIVREPGAPFDYRLSRVDREYLLTPADGNPDGQRRFKADGVEAIEEAVLRTAQQAAIAHLPANPGCPWQATLKLVRVRARMENGTDGKPYPVYDAVMPTPAGPACFDYHPKDYYAVVIRVDARTPEEASITPSPAVALLDLLPDGNVKQLWPDPTAVHKGSFVPIGRDCWLSTDSANPWTAQPGEKTAVGYVEPDSGGVGTEVLKLMVTKEYVDFSDVLTTTISRGNEPSDPLANLLSHYSRATRGLPPPPPKWNNWTTAQQILHVFN